MTKVQKKNSYKYKIKEKFDLLPYGEHMMAKRMLPKVLKINIRTLEKYMYTKINDSYEMPAGHLAVLASFFNCAMEDMFYSLPKQYTLMLLGPSNKNELAKNLNLTK